MHALPLETESNQGSPPVLIGYISVKSRGGTSALSLAEPPETSGDFQAESGDLVEARQATESTGLQLIAESRLGLSVAGPPEAFEELTGGRVVARERLVLGEGGRQRYVTHFDIVGDGQPAALGVGRVNSNTRSMEGVILERPRVPSGVFPSPFPPPVSEFHLRVPDDVAVALGAASVHRQGNHGEGVRVAMVDSGQYAHPFFLAHGYDVRPAQTVVPGTSPTKDPHGHGTGESANVFAAAPGASLRPVRATNDAAALVGALAGFLAAKNAAEQPQILTNSWGGDQPFPPFGPPDSAEIVMALEILDAIDQGIFVVFSAGNGQFSIEPQVPGVLAAGGVYMTDDIELRASSYASGYESPWFNVTVPDVCGLVGMAPRAQYIMLPVPPGLVVDVSESRREGRSPGDGTSTGDGWALFSGTSAAAPQIAGVAALILAAKPNLTPLQVTASLKETAIDVRAGRCHVRFNYPAEPGHDRATGHGLVNAAAAVEYAIENF